MNFKEATLVYRSTFLYVQRWAPIPLRLIVGYGFMAHGFAKIVKGPDHFFSILQAWVFLHPNLWAGPPS